MRNLTYPPPSAGSPRADWREDDNKPVIPRIPGPRRPLDVTLGRQLDAVGDVTRALCAAKAVRRG
jgi:hypothetical protein